MSVSPLFSLFHGDALGQVAGLVDVAPALQRNVVRQQLQRHHAQLGQQHRLRLRHGQHPLHTAVHPLRAALGGERQHMGASRLHLHHVAHGLVEQRHIGGGGNDRRPLLDEGDGAVLQLAGGVGLGVDVGDLLELQASLQRQGVVQIAADKEDLLVSRQLLGGGADIRRIGEDKETIYICFVTSADRKLEGIVTVKDLLLAEDDTVIENLMDTNVIFATTTEDQESVAEKISDYDLMAIPVVDLEGRLVGIVTVDDVIDVMEEETTEDFEIMAGMTPSDKPYSRTGTLEMWKNRIPWLMFLMLSATFTSMILTKFEDMLAVQAGLVAFIPMLMGTGGNSGAQASTAVIRSLSLGDTEPKDAFRVMWKEWRVAAICGITLAAVNFVKMLLLDGMLLHNDSVTIAVAATVSVSIVFIVMFAKVVGSMLPIIAEKVGVDPAVMANPLISTVTDAVSLLIYINVAKLILHI